MLPALALAGVAAWALRLDRAAAVTEADQRAREIAQAVALTVTNFLGTATPDMIGPIEAGALPSSEGGPDLMVLDDENRLLWPAPGSWPPIPAGSVGSSAARLALDQALALRTNSEPAPAATALHQVFLQSPPDALTEAGLSVREVAAHAILEIAGDDLERWPQAWRSGDTETLRALAQLRSTPIAEAAIERVQAWIPILRQRGFITSPPGAAEAHFRRRSLIRRAYAMLSERHSSAPRDARPAAGASRSWADVMSFDLDRQVWLAIRRPGTLGSETAQETSTRRRRVFFLVRWADVFGIAREELRRRDAREHFGVSFQMAAPGLSLFQEEPAGVEGRATARWASTLPYGLGMSVAVALERPDLYFAAQRRGERLLGGVVTAAVGLSILAAAVTWWMLVRQHRLGVQKSNFVASVSHELRAPLASVRLLADNLEQDRVPDPDRRRKTVRLMGRECRRLGALVDNVLDLSRIERGKRSLDPEPTDVAALVQETVRVTATMGDEREVVMSVEIEPSMDGWVATVDGPMLQQILVNLLDNALKHAPPRSTVDVRLKRDEDPAWFRLEVVDAGPGIPAEERERVFEPFHRLGHELRREHAGVGIGLAIVKHGVEAHGGRVWVESVTPTGARLVVRLPFGSKTGTTTVAEGNTTA
ncbi:MAG: HAMP domain-containing histidine kinase [Verrucomicrobiales bacterium]|nr:HAMP domain-containing histidine kinase [Verrucomicrobiales bacterium]